MTDMKKLIEVLTRVAEALESQNEFHEIGRNLNKKSHDMVSMQSRFTAGTSLVNMRLSGLIETPEAIKMYNKFEAKLSEKVLSLVIKSEWDKALKCYITGTEELRTQLVDLNGKKKDANKTQYT